MECRFELQGPHEPAVRPLCCTASTRHPHHEALQTSRPRSAPAIHTCSRSANAVGSARIRSNSEVSSPARFETPSELHICSGGAKLVQTSPAARQLGSSAARQLATDVSGWRNLPRSNSLDRQRGLNVQDEPQLPIVDRRRPAARSSPVRRAKQHTDSLGSRPGLKSRRIIVGGGAGRPVAARCGGWEVATLRVVQRLDSAELTSQRQDVRSRSVQHLDGWC